MRTLNIICFFLILFPVQAKQTDSTTSSDGLEITLDAYIDSNGLKQPLIVLFHQAGWSRGEYSEIAPKLNKLGFKAIAVDLRSGNKINSVINQTAKRARESGKSTTYIDALPDMEAALIYARQLTGSKAKIIAWGSSYSSALALQLVGEKPYLADVVLAFSPGEYFKKAGKPATWIKDSAKSLGVPVFITSSRSEKKRWKAIFDGIKSKDKVSFIPTTKGNHGSRALWDKYNDSDAYWNAVSMFLTNLPFNK